MNSFQSPKKINIRNQKLENDHVEKESPYREKCKPQKGYSRKIPCYKSLDKKTIYKL